MSNRSRIEKLEKQILTKKTDDFIFLTFVSMDMSRELHSITRVNTGQSISCKDTECKSTDEFLEHVSNEWNVDVSSKFHKDNEVIEIK